MKELLTAKEAAQFLNINEKKLYSLAAKGKIPGTMLTGKWLFSRSQLEEFIKKKGLDTIYQFSTQYSQEKDIILAAGSDDPLLQFIFSQFHNRYLEYTVFYSTTGSLEGLKILKKGYAHIAFSHLYDFIQQDFNFPYLNQVDLKEKVTVINLFQRQIGFLTGNDLDIDCFQQIIARDLTFVNRQKNSGIRNLVDQLTRHENITTDQIKGFKHEVYTHYEVAIEILNGKAEVGIATQFAADLLKLNFKPLLKERFDLIISREHFFNHSIQALIQFIQSKEFMNNLSHFKGYDFQDSGKMMQAINP